MLYLLKLLVRVWNAIEFVLLTLVLYLLSFLPTRFLEGFYERLFYFWARVFVRALDVDVRLHQHYAGKLPEHYIVIANHPSAFEDIGLPSLFNASSVAKEGVRHWFMVGRISVAAGTIFLKRDDKSSRAAAGDAIAEALRDGRNIAIYPEGGCFGRRINPFLYGIFGISLETGVPIIPVFIHYEAQHSFEWQGQTLPQKIWQILTARNRTANFHVYEPFRPQDFDDRETFCATVHGHYLHWQEVHLTHTAPDDVILLSSRSSISPGSTEQ
ncbi:MAG: 1-acyl-sn-glycerol-3-phosphate acyltransferase [Gammaproteobacteria bacterium]|nr:1-acyl-sn-glycerol-3-phosphate acyltransferase [Gammaproteobacteria bacterium]